MSTTYTHCTLATGVVTIDDGYVSGTIESDVLDAGSVAARWWSVLCDSYETDSVTLGECTFALGSGEARMRTLLSREATVHAPGADFSVTLADAGLLEAAGAICGAFTGSHTAAVVEARWSDDNITWTDYGPWTAGWRSSRYMQVRVTLHRRGSAWQRSVSKLLATCAA